MSKDILKLHLIVLLWGFTAILGVLISLPAIEVVFYRTSIAALALGFLALYRKKSLRVSSATLAKLFATGLLVGLHWTLFFASAKVSKVSICLAGMATASLFTAFLEPLFNRGKLKFYEILLGLVVVGGLYTIFRFEYDHALGLSLALASAFLAAVFTILNGRFSKVHTSLKISFYEMIGACVAALISFPVYQHWLAPESSFQWQMTLADAFYIGILSLACTVWAFYASNEILRNVSAFQFILTVNLEPVYGILLAFLFFGESEKMTSGFYFGTLIILIAVLSYPLIDQKFRPKKFQNTI